MKSKLKLKHIILQIFIFAGISGYSTILLINFYDKFLLWMKFIAVFAIIVLPAWAYRNFLKIPKFEILEDRIIEVSKGIEREIKFSDVSEIILSRHLSKSFSMGKYYSLVTKDSREMDIPYKFYSNEKEIMDMISKKVALNK